MRKFIFLIIYLAGHSLSAQDLKLAAKPKDHQVGQVLFQTFDTPSVYAVEKAVFPNRFSPNAAVTLTLVSQELNIYKFTFDTTLFKETVILNIIKQHPKVVAAQFNHIAQLRSTPNDPLFKQQWGLQKIIAPSVWDKTTGGLTACGDTIVVAVLDKGFDVNHNDLKGNIWYNRLEIPNNNIDDDKNGFTDDYAGFNFLSNNDKHSKETHGTNCLGIIGASGNNGNGITGVNWKIKMLPLSVYDDESIVKAYLYAHDLRKKYMLTGGKQGAYVAVTSMSLGYDNKRPEDFPLICNVFNALGQQGILSVVAATNLDMDINVSGDIPGLCPSDHLIVVTSTKEDDTKSAFGYSKKFVDLAAPGENIMTTFPNNNNDPVGGGNSFAAPLVAGSIALLYSLPQNNLCQISKTDPVKAMNAVKESVLTSIDMLPTLQSKTASGGRLNLSNSYNKLSRLFGMPIGDFDILKLFPNPANNEVNLQLQLPEKAEVEIVISNTMGQIVYQRKIVDKDLLSNKISINTQRFSAGLYFMSILSTEYKATRKFLVAHL